MTGGRGYWPMAPHSRRSWSSRAWRMTGGRGYWPMAAGWAGLLAGRADDRQRGKQMRAVGSEPVPGRGA